MDKHVWSRLVMVVLGLACCDAARAGTLASGSAGPERERVLTGWGGGDPGQIVPKAAHVGFREIVVWNQDPAYLKKLVSAAAKYGIDVYVSLTLSDLKGWKARYPKDEVPLQVMNDRERAAFNRIAADRTVGKSRYQSGGEPVQEIEVLTWPLLCFHNPRVVDLFKEQIRAILGVPGVRGIAFDFFGYQNYRCCRCSRSMALFEQYAAAHPNASKEAALNDFSLDTLVSFNNELADYVRKIRPGAKVIDHVYPLFWAEPLYGNRLNVDVCGQTAAWFFEPFWSMEKITRYSQVISGQAGRYFPRARGAALIGYFSRPKEWSVKSPARVEVELKAIFAGGCSRVQVCSMNDVLDNPPVAEIFRKYFGKPAAANRP